MIKFLDKTIYYLLLIFIAIFPAYLIRFDFFKIPTTFLEIFLYFVFILFIIKNYLKIKNKEKLNIKPFIKKNKFILLFIFIFLGSAIISTINSKNIIISAGLLKAYFFDPVLFLIIFINTININRLKNVLISFVFSAVFISLVSYIYLISNKLTYDGRLESIFNSPNFLAMSLAVSIIILFSILDKKLSFIKIEKSHNYIKDNPIKIIISLLVLLSIPFFMTFSMGSFFAIFVSILFIVFRSSGGSALKAFYILTIIILIMLFVLIFLDKEKLNNIFKIEERSSLSSRIMIWNSSLKILKENYLIGIGPGMFQKYYLEKQNEFEKPYLEWAVPYPHNIFLAFWIQNGLLGIISFLLILFWMIKTSLKIKNDKLKLYSNTSLAFIVYIVIHGMVDTPYWKNDLSLIFFLFLSILLVIKNNKIKTAL